MVTTNRKALLARYLLLLLALVVMPFPHMTGMASQRAQSGCVTFPANLTGIYKQVCGRFAKYWNEHGGLAQQGYPLTPEIMEINQQDGKTYLIQYFERAVFEYHPEFAGSSNDVLLSLLGASYYRIRYPKGADRQQPNFSPGSMSFEVTGKRLGGRFLEYWLANGSLAQQGMPVSDEFPERNAIDGKEYTVQYFERAVFEFHPGNARPNDVLLSLLGVFRLHSALVQQYDPPNTYKGWVCHPPQRHEHSKCAQTLGAVEPGPTIPNEPAVDGKPPNATLAQQDDVLLANAAGTLRIRYAAADLTLGRSTKLGLWRSGACTDPYSVTALNANVSRNITVASNPSVVLVNDPALHLQVASPNGLCVDPKGTLYGVRVWPDGNTDVAVSSGAQGALVIEPSGRKVKVLPGQQVHASPAGKVGKVGSIDAEFSQDFARHTDPNHQGSAPLPDPPRTPDWASSLLHNGDFEAGTLASWTTPINAGRAAIATRPLRAGTYSAMVTSVGKVGTNSGIAGGGNCPGGNRVPVAPNNRYSWAGWVFIPESEGHPTARLVTYWYSACSGGNPVSGSVSSTTEATGQWIKLAGQWVAPGNATHALLSMELVPTSNAEGIAYFDDLQLNATGGPVPTNTPPPPVVTNLLVEGFETQDMKFRSGIVSTGIPMAVETPGPSGWVKTANTNGGAGWESHNGFSAIFARDVTRNAGQTLTTISPVAIPANSVDATLSFWHRYDLGRVGYPYEAQSAGVLETSTDAGSTWRDVSSTTAFLAGGYTGTTGNTSAGNPLGGNRAGWTGTNGGYTQAQIDLLPFAGRNLLFRFYLGSPDDVYGCCASPRVGWQIDDILVAITYTPGTAGALYPALALFPATTLDH
jgi:hypothetical protein